MVENVYEVYRAVLGGQEGYVLTRPDGRRNKVIFSRNEKGLYNKYSVDKLNSGIELISFYGGEYEFIFPNEEVKIDRVSLDDMKRLSNVFGNRVIGMRVYRADKIDLGKDEQKRFYGIQITDVDERNLFSFRYFYSMDCLIEQLVGAFRRNRDLFVDSHGEEGPYMDVTTKRLFVLSHLSESEIFEIRKNSGIRCFV